MKLIIDYIMAFLAEIFTKFKVYIINTQLNKQKQITKEKVNEANKLADDFLSKHKSYIEQRRNVRPVVDTVRDGGGSTEGSNK